MGYDVVRHLYFGDEQTKDQGYQYYPELEILMKALQELVKLEKKYCWDAK